MLWAHFALCARAPARPRRTSRRGSHTPLAERRAPAHAQSGGPAQVHTPLAGRRSPVTLWWRTGAGARSLTGGAWPVALWRADRRVHAPLREARRRTAVEGGPARVHAPLREARRRTAVEGGPARVHAPLREARRRTAVEGGPARVHAPLREARRRSRCGGRIGAGARSLAGGAEHRLPVAARGSIYVRNLTINPLDKACQVSSAPGIGRGARREGEGGRFANRPYGRRQGPAFAGNDGSRRVSKGSRYGPEGGASA